MNNLVSDEYFTKQAQVESLRKASEGNRNAYDKIVKVYYAFVLKLTRFLFATNKHYFPYDDANDLAQEVMIRFPSIIENFICASYSVSFEAFLTGSVKYIVLDQAKKALAKKRSLEDISESISEEIEEEILFVRLALYELKCKDSKLYDVVLNYYFFGEEDSKIALEQNTTRTQIWRIRKKALLELANFL